MTVECIEKDTDDVAPAGDDIVGRHEVKGHNCQNYSRISCGAKKKTRIEIRNFAVFT